MAGVLDTLIWDRTQLDVNRARYLNGLWDAGARRWTGTQAEWEEWAAGPRGAYGWNDMNRVTQAVAYLTGHLEKLGYSVATDGIVPAYSIQIGIDPAAGGSASGGGIFYRGDKVTVTARPGEKYNFFGWAEAGKIVSGDLDYTFIAERSRSLTAVFALKQFRVDVSVDPDGSGKTTGGGVYDIGTEVTVAATAEEGYIFTRWTEGGETVAEGPEYTFILDQNRALSAVMTKTHVIAVAQNDPEGGTVSGGGTYLDGQTVTVAAVAGNGYEFVGWAESGQTVSTEAVYSFQAESDRELTAQFVKTHVITLLVDPAGWGTAQGSGAFREGAQITISATPGSGYRFVAWQSSGEQVSASNPYTFTVSEDQTLTALFEEAPVYIITAAIDPPEAGTVTGEGQYQEGDTVTLTATINDGYTFTGWQENGQTVSTDNPYTFTAAGNRAFTAAFSVASRLPAGYTELEYIESSGTQYIDTGLLPSAVGKVQMGVVEVSGTASFQNFFGSQISLSGTKRYAEYYMSYTSSQSVVAAMDYKSGSYVYYTVVANSVPKTDIELELDYINARAAVNGKSISGISKGTYSYQPNIWIFSVARKTSTSGSPTSNNPFSGKVGYCKMYNQSNVLSRDFVPCTNPSGVVGLYDLVGAKFYANAGTGAFIAGPAV